MEFTIGDKVMHPRFGAGRITGEDHRELVHGFRHYFVINVLRTGATAYVPVRKMDELGVRPAMSGTTLVQVLGALGSVPARLSNDYKLRQALVEERLETHRPIPVAEAVRDLTWLGTMRRLTTRDEALLKRGRELLATEIALATDAGVPDAHDMIDSALSTAVAHRSDGD